MNKKGLALGLFLVTFAVLVNEIMLTAIFHVIIGQVNTVLAIAVAMLGLSLGGMAVYLWPGLKNQSGFRKTARNLLFGFVAATIGSVALIMNIPINHGDFFYQPGFFAQALKFAVYLSAVLPFFIGGIFINLVFYMYPGKISQLYFSSLIGSALGCAFSFPLLESFGAPKAIIYSVLPVIFPACVCADFKKPLSRALFLLFCLVLTVEIADFSNPFFKIKKLNTYGDVNDPSYRGFLIHQGDIEYEKWSPDAWTIVRSARIPQQWENFQGWGLSKKYRGSVPKIKLVNFNSRFTTYVTEFDGNFSKIGAWLDSDLISLHYLIGKDYSKVLNIGAGGGREVLNALNHNAREVTAVDISGATVNGIMKGYFKEFSGNLYAHPKVKALVEEGRTFIRSSKEKFDLIDFTIVGGANIEKTELINADSLFTLEALGIYLDHLEAAGVFSYVMYNFNSDILDRGLRQEPREAIPYVYIPAVKTLTGLRLAFEKTYPSGEFKNCVLIAGIHGVINKKYDLVHIIMSKSPFSVSERRMFLEKTRELGFEVFYPSESGNLYARIAEERDIRSLAGRMPFDIYPPEDDRPFQYNFTWHKQGRCLFSDPLIVNSISFGLVSILFLISPLLLRAFRKSGSFYPPGSWSMLLFFALIGCSYMLIEMVVILKLQLYLGNPVFAVSVALFALLFSSGLGSYCTKWIRESGIKTALRRGTIGLWISGLLFYFSWNAISANSVVFSVPVRMLIAVAAIFPLAFFMGMFFPVGIKALAEKDRNAIPLIWAVNGCFSILSLFTGRVLALFWGFNAVLLCGLLIYLLAFGNIYYGRRSARNPAA